MTDNKIKNRQILVIDDEEAILYAFKKSLSIHGYNVATVTGYDMALNILDEVEIDLVFSDIRLTDKSGIDILREIKNRKLICPVVLITGYADVNSASEAVRFGAYDYLIKPIKLDVILRVTRMALQHKDLVEEMEKHRSNLDAIFGNVKDGIITVDKELNIIEVNKAAEKTCGVLSKEMKGKKIDSVELGCNRKCLDSIIKTVKTKQHDEVLRIECNHQNKPKQVISVSTFPLINKNEKFYAVGMVLHDETRIVNLECDLMENYRIGAHKMIGQSEKMQKVYSLIDNLVEVQTSVLITGESGTGKELVAEALHYKRGGEKKTLVKVN